MRWIALCGLALVLVLAVAHRLVASRPVDATISLGSQPAAPYQYKQPTTARLHVGIAHITSPVPSFRKHQALAEKLAAAVHAEAELLQPDSYKALNALLRKGKVDVAFVCSGTYAAEPDAMDILASPVINGKSEYYGLIIVPPNSPVQKFADLRGKSFLFVEEESNTGQWYPCRRACELVGKTGAFFSSTKFTGAHDLSILAIAGNLADGAAVSSTIYESMVAHEPALKERVRIIEQSPPFPSPPVVVRKSMPAEERRLLLQVLVTLSDTEDGRDILRGIGCDKFVPARNEDYAGIERYTP